MTWWYWMLLGLLLLAAETMTPGGFYILFFGLSALVVGTLGGLGLIETDWLQWLLFSLFAVGSLLLFRGPLLASIKKAPTEERTVDSVDSMVGETAIPLEPLAVGAVGKAELRGTTWTAKNVGAAPLSKGQRGRVMRVDGLTLWVTAE